MTPEERDEEDEVPGYDLVMPFVVCVSQGGPFDDAAFVAGCRYGEIDRALRTIRTFGITEFVQYVEPALVPQLDLLAMHLHWTLETEPWEDHPDDWVRASFEARPISEDSA